MFEQEVVTEKEGREFAKNIGAIFYLTSAKYNVGINDLFNNLGRKFLDIGYTHKQIKKDVGEDKGKKSIKLKISKTKKKKKKS